MSAFPNSIQTLPIVDFLRSGDTENYPSDFVDSLTSISRAIESFEATMPNKYPPFEIKIEWDDSLSIGFCLVDAKWRICVWHAEDDRVAIGDLPACRLLKLMSIFEVNPFPYIESRLAIQQEAFAFELADILRVEYELTDEHYRI